MKKKSCVLRAACCVLLAAIVACSARKPDRVLRVCADPNNLPFSNARSEGLENKLAELIAQDLNKKLVYTWWAERKGFVRDVAERLPEPVIDYVRLNIVARRAGGA